MRKSFQIILIALLEIQLTQIISAHNLTECTRFHTKNITGGQILTNGSYQYKDELYPPGHFGDFNYYLHENGTQIGTEAHVRGCICTHSERKCIRVCCDYVDDGNENWTLPEICPYQFKARIFHNVTQKEIFLEKDYVLVYDILECKNSPNGELLEFEYNVYENGSIYLPEYKSFIDFEKHCVAVDRERSVLLILGCFDISNNS